MQRKRVLIVFIVLMVLTGACYWYLCPIEKGRGQTVNRTKTGLSERSQKDDHNERLAQYMAEDYRIVSDNEIIPKSPVNVFESQFDPKSYPGKKLWIAGFSKIEDNPPQVEMRFVKPGPDGKMVPQPVWSFSTQGIWDGYTVDRDHSLLDTSFRNPPWSTKKNMSPQGPNHACAFRCPLAKKQQDRSDFKGFYMGRIYFINFKMLPSKVTEENRTANRLWKSSFVKMPDDVPPGHVAVMNIDMTRDVKSQWWLKRDDPRKTVRVKLADELAHRTKGLILADAAARGDDWNMHTLKEKTTAKLEVKKLGGELVAVSKGTAGIHAVCYVSNVTDQKINLPQDADFVVSKNEVIRFQLKTPRARITDVCKDFARMPEKNRPWTDAIWLTMKEKRGLMVAGADLPRDNLPESVALNFVPGDYYVVYQDGDAGRRKTIGKITVEESDAGKTLEVEPLEE